MCKTRNTLLLAALLSVAMLPACNKGGGSTSSANPAAAKTDGKEVAVVNGTPISKEMFDAYSKQRAASQPNAGTPDDQKAALDEVVSREVIYQDALKGGLDKNPDVQAEIENLKRNIIANAAIRHHLEVNEPTDAVMKKEYEEKMGNMKSKEYKAKHILVKTETEAKDIIAQLDKGGDFAKLAAEKSVDTASGKDGGELGWFDGSQMVKPFADAAAAMEKGKYSKTPVQSQFGWHVILLEDSRELAPPEFDKVKENVRGIIKNKQLKEYLEGLKSKAKVEIKQANAAPAGMAPPAIDKPAEAAKPEPAKK